MSSIAWKAVILYLNYMMFVQAALADHCTVWHTKWRNDQILQE